jgi:hypothetical protein
MNYHPVRVRSPYDTQKVIDVPTLASHCIEPEAICCHLNTIVGKIMPVPDDGDICQPARSEPFLQPLLDPHKTEVTVIVVAAGLVTGADASPPVPVTRWPARSGDRRVRLSSDLQRRRGLLACSLAQRSLGENRLSRRREPSRSSTSERPSFDCGGNAAAARASTGRMASVAATCC